MVVVNDKNERSEEDGERENSFVTDYQRSIMDREENEELNVVSLQKYLSGGTSGEEVEKRR